MATLAPLAGRGRGPREREGEGIGCLKSQGFRGFFRLPELMEVNAPGRSGR